MNTIIEKTAINKKDLSFAVAGLFITTIFIFSTNPAQLAAPFLLVLPLLALLTTYYISKVVIGFFANLSPAHTKILSMVLATAPMLLIIFGSVSGLGVQDVALSLLLVSGFGWYVKRTYVSADSSVPSHV